MIRSHFPLALLLSLCACLASALPAMASEDSDRVRQQVLEALLQEEGGVKPQDVEWLLKNMSASGRWPDIDYQDVSAARWKPREHLERVLHLAGAWATPKGAFTNSATVLDACRRGLGLWLDKDYQSKNWWYNEISVPKRMGSIMLLLEPQLEPETLHRGLDIVNRGWARPDPEDWEANTNQVDRAFIRILQGCLTRDAAMLGEAFASASFTLTQDPAQARKTGGIQPDLSFQMHGPQLYTGGYGLQYPAYVLEIARFARGTQWALTPVQLDTLLRYMLDHQRWVVRARWLDPATLGRNISRPQADDASILDRGLELASLFNPSRLDEINAFREEIKTPGRGGPVGNRQFWCSDYMTHRRPGVLASVKMVSSRTRGTETGNNENLKGQHLSQGSFFLLRRGDDYSGLFPVWNWRMVPGVTAAQDPGPFSQYKWGRGSEGETDFAGGVSDGMNGLAAMDFRSEGLAARKSWFFFDDLALLLGAGISHPGGPVFTTIDQRRLSGSLVGTDPAGKPLSPAPVTLTAPSQSARWVWNGGVGWLSMDDSPLQVRAAVQEGDWQDINQSYDSIPASEKVLSLWKDHGVSPREATYAVLVGLAQDEAAFRTLVKSPSVQVLANTPALQAAACPSRNLTGAAFYAPGELTIRPGLILQAVQPCLVWLVESQDTMAVSVANPRNQGLTAELRLSFPLVGEGATPEGGQTRLSLPLPEHELAGSTRTEVYKKGR
ncbi:polysaccharide lyase family 8 super-sandwich domain-containing protein [Megalodesulfovibrio paquesii]